MQPEFTIELPATRPLIKLSSLEDFFDRDHDSLVADADSGIFRFAWDISAPGTRRREVRVWRDSALAVWHNRPLPQLTEDEIYKRILPGRDVRSTELERILSCSQELVRDLERSGCLRAAQARWVGSGPNAYTLYSRDGVVEFLRSRLMARA